MMQKQTINRNHTEFDFHLLPGSNTRCDPLTTLAGHFPVSHMIDITTAILHPDDHSIFHFQYSIQSIIYNSQHLLSGFVLDDFAQL